MCVCYHDELKQYAWIGLCSVLRPRQHSIGFVGDGFYRSKDPTNSIKILKETECIDLHWTTSVGSGSEHLKRWSEGQKLAVFASSLRCFFTNSPELTTVTVCWPEFHTINSTDRLQSVLNTAARLIVGAKKHDHIKHVLRDRLHWLPVPQRVQFKLSADIQGSAWTDTVAHRRPLSTSHIRRQQTETPIRHSWRPCSLFLCHALWHPHICCGRT